jgi:hypothetical protein
MNKSDLEKWVLETFWPAYCGLVKTPVVTSYGSGGRGEAIKKILTLKPSEELRRCIIDAISAQIRHRRTLFNKCGSMQKYVAETNKIKFYCNRNGATWINQMGWKDEIPSLITDEVKYTESASHQPCKTTGCSNNAIGGAIDVCQACECKTHDIYRDEKREYLLKIGLKMDLGETLHSYAMRCRKHTFSNPINVKKK